MVQMVQFAKRGLLKNGLALISLGLVGPLSRAAQGAMAPLREDLLRQAEASLANLQAAQALALFEKAALIAHSSDTEMGIVRAHMQAGNYQRAVAFAAHAAGAHLDEVEATALYAWLLWIGGQQSSALRLLDDAKERKPRSGMIASVQQQLRSARPLAVMPSPGSALRLLPYGGSAGIAKGAKTIGSGLLCDAGRRVLVPVDTLRRLKTSVWVRTAIGDFSQATIEQQDSSSGIGVLKLKKTATNVRDPVFSGVAAFPGSIGYVSDFVPASHSNPAWPLLSSGFLGTPTTGVSDTKRSIAVGFPDGPRGGPVFDKAGIVVGLALPNHQMILAPELLKILGGLRVESRAMTDKMPQKNSDQIYEQSLHNVVQIIT
jgi:hypothetical protein